MVRTHRGFSLVEAIIASFLMLTAVIMSVSVFDSTLQAEASNEKRVIASLVAESAMAEMRTFANQDFFGLQSAFDGRNWTLPEYPHHEISTKVLESELAVPCSVLESQYSRTASFPAPTGRYMTKSVLKGEVTVTWADGRNQSVTITENLTNFAPANDFTVVLLKPGGSPATESDVINIAKNGEMEFSAEARSGGQLVEDIQFNWYVQALTGFGSIATVSRDGERCIYKNAYRNFADNKKFAPGACRLVVTATYQGRESDAKVRIENAE